MLKNPKGERYTPLKNYIYAGLIIIAIALLCWYVLSWYNIKKTEKYLNSYLLSTNTLNLEIKGLDAASTILQDAPSSYFVFVGYTGDKDEYELEQGLKVIIDKYRINSEMYYIDITLDKDDKNLNSKLNKVFDTNVINNITCLIYFKDGKVVDIIESKTGIFNSSEFENLLKEQEYMKEAN